MKKISVIIPVYYNEQDIQLTFKSLKESLSTLPNSIDYEMIFVEDGSRDKSFDELVKVYNADKTHVKIIKFTRNFGQISAWVAGIEYATGDSIVVISADLQDPASLIPNMVEEWEKGSKVVICTRKSREDGIFRKITSRMFYEMMRRYAIPNMPTGGFDYFLIDKEIKNIILQMKENNLFLQGHILWPGYEPKIISYTRKKRKTGKGRWSFFKKIKYFIDGFTGYSFFPIRFMSFAGLILFISGALLSVLLILHRIFYGTRLAGWSSIMVAILVFNGFQFMMLGIIGEYLWRNLIETRKRPLYIVEKVIK